MKACTCGEQPYSGHLLWCDALIGRPEYRPRTVTPETLTDEMVRSLRDEDRERGVRANGEWAIASLCDLALQRGTLAWQVAQRNEARQRICDAINAAARSEK